MEVKSHHPYSVGVRVMAFGYGCSMDSESDEIRTSIKALGKGAIARLSRASGVHANTLQNFASGTTTHLRADNLSKVKAAIRQLRQEVAPDGAEPLPLALTGRGAVEVAGDNYTAIPVYDLSAAAGAGALVEDGAPSAHWLFREEELRRLTRSNYEFLSLITVTGDSMWETLHHGDQVLVDRSVSRVRRDGIYVIQIEDELMIKRCSIDIDEGTIELHSDNKNYPVRKVKKVDRLRVVGRVVWMARALG